MNAHWLLIFPPVDYAPPRHPFHEVGYTAARLCALGIRTTFLDLNLAFFEHHLDPARLDRAIATGSSGSGAARPAGEPAAVDRARSRLAENLDVVRGRAGRPASANGLRHAHTPRQLHPARTDFFPPYCAASSRHCSIPETPDAPITTGPG